LYMVLATLSLANLSTCPNQLNHLYFMYLTVFSLLTASSNSSFPHSNDFRKAACWHPKT
jgi:hypothetical protein